MSAGAKAFLLILLILLLPVEIACLAMLWAGESVYYVLVRIPFSIIKSFVKSFVDSVGDSVSEPEHERSGGR